MDKVIFHIDVNNAFLSWSAVYLLKNGQENDIRQEASIIGGDEKERKGIVLAKSPIAKKYHIKTAETIYSAKKKCPDLKIYKPNYKWYQEKSKELMKYLATYSPKQEQISIDECFLDMSGMKYIYNDLIKLAYKIKDEIKTNFGYTVNIGIANNRLCAKMASDFEKPDKVHTLFKDEIVTKLWPLDVGKLYMCGKKTKEALNKMNVITVEDLAKTDINKLEKEFKSQAKYLKNAAMGIDDTEIEERYDKRKSISTTETLRNNSSNEAYLKEVILRQVEEVTKELREKKLYAKTVTIIYKNSNFVSSTVQKTLDNPTNSTKEILKLAYKIFDESYESDEIRLIGVRLSGLEEQGSIQVSIFDEPEEIEEDNGIQETIDTINNKFGKNIIKRASLKALAKETLKNNK